MRETKSIIRLYVDTPLSGGAEITLDNDQSHYLVNVMRQKAGASLLLFNGQHGEWQAALTEPHKKHTRLRIDQQTRPMQQEPDVWLVFAPLKRARTDYLAQKASELGAAALLPVMTSRTVADRVNVARLHANAVEAAEQCERLSVPQTFPPQKLATLLKDWPEDRRILFCDEDLSGETIADKLAGLAQTSHIQPIENRTPWAIFIGPEGGFTDTERAAIKALPVCTTVSLGPRLLRADTAAVAALSLWQAHIGDWR